MASSTLTADIESFVASSLQRTKDVVLNSIQDVTEAAQTPVAKGGRMRVDTGFLRASGRGSLEGFPSGRSAKSAEEIAATGKRTGAFDTYDGTAVNAVINTMELGDTFYFGWTANYAAVRELHDGFLETSLQNWQQFVTANSEKYRGR